MKQVQNLYRTIFVDRIEKSRFKQEMICNNGGYL